MENEDFLLFIMSVNKLSTDLQGYRQIRCRKIKINYNTLSSFVSKQFPKKYEKVNTCYS